VGIYADRVLETTTTTGTGDVTLAGAVTGYRTINAAQGTGVFFDYAIVAVDGSGVPTGDWETGQGYLSGSTTLVRARIFASSNAGSAVNLAAGTKRVFITISQQRGFTQGQAAARTAGMEMP